MPYGETRSNDRIRLPYLVAGETIAGEFVLRDDGESMHSYEMEIGVNFG